MNNLGQELVTVERNNDNENNQRKVNFWKYLGQKTNPSLSNSV